MKFVKQMDSQSLKKMGAGPCVKVQKGARRKKVGFKVMNRSKAVKWSGPVRSFVLSNNLAIDSVFPNEFLLAMWDFCLAFLHSFRRMCYCPFTSSGFISIFKKILQVICSLASLVREIFRSDDKQAFRLSLKH